MHTSGCTVEAYAEAKRLQIDFLRSVSVTDYRDSRFGYKVLRIPYRDADGNEPAVRLRAALLKDEGGDNRFLWRKGSKPFLYGLWRLDHARAAGYVVIVEGESDCHTLWQYGIPAVGVPGAGNWREERDAEYLEGIERVYVVIEPDSGGEAVLDWLAHSRIRDRAWLVELGEHKDPSALHIADPRRFSERWQASLERAEPWRERAEVEVEAIAGSIARWTPSTNGSRVSGSRIPRTDLGNAQRFAAEHAAWLRHVRDRRMWLGWDGIRWRRDATGDAERAAKQTVRRLFEDAVGLEGDERRAAVGWALASQSEARIRAMFKLAATEPQIALAPDALDRDPWKFSCANGTLDLRTGELRPHDAADLITLGTDIAYSPAATCGRWQRFLREIFANDPELIAFVQRLVGYCLTGDIREHLLAVLHGPGCNGKSTFIGVLKRLLGDYAVTAAFDTFMRQRNRGGPRNDLARLHRARLVTAAESGEGRRLDEATVKEITGGDTIAARFLYGEHFEFIPQFKLVLVTNHCPRVDGDDDAIWRRLRLVPFEQSFEGREDRELGAKLEAELPGILAWAVEGCLAWLRDGIGEAAAVTHATAEYRQDEDLLGAFLAERCVTHGEVATADFREAYEQYCREVGEQPLGASVLGKRLAKRGIHRDQRSDGDRGRVYRGVSLR